MQPCLARPIWWWSGGQFRLLRGTQGLSAYELALLARMRRILWVPDLTPYHGDTMSGDTSAALRLVTPAAAEPVTLAQAKAFLRIEHAGDDAAITTAIATARQYAENYLRSALLAQTWDYSVANPGALQLPLPVGPVSSITSITLTNELGSNSTLAAQNYRLSVDGFSVHFTTVPQIEKLTVRFVAGAYASAADIPAPIIQGILHHIAAQMEQRDSAGGLPLQSLTSYTPWRRVAL